MTSKSVDFASNSSSKFTVKSVKLLYNIITLETIILCTILYSKLYNYTCNKWNTNSHWIENMYSMFTLIKQNKN
jgi:hypothetical protein